jgi:deoxyguanosine kinase
MKQIFSHPSQFIISVEGNIGSGKSTFLKKIEEHISCSVIYEPHTQWQNINNENLLDLFYKDMHRWAYSFQTYVFLTRIRAQEVALEQNPEKNVFICERSVVADRYTFARALHNRGDLSEIEWNMYCSWYVWMVNNHVRLPHLFIYLQASPEISYQRINKRMRDEEKGVDFNYIQLLNQYHDDWLIDKKDMTKKIAEIPVLVLDCNKDFASDSKEWSILVEKVVTAIKTYTDCNCC